MYKKSEPTPAPVAVKSRADSQNWLVALITLILTGIVAQGISVPEDAAGTIAEAIGSGQLFLIIGALTPNLILPIMKVVAKAKEGPLDWAFLYSPNFITQIVSVILLVLELTGVIPPSGGTDSTAVVHTLNSAYHFGQPAKAAA